MDERSYHQLTQRRFGPGIDDAIILPLVLTALIVKWLLKTALSILIHILDYAFPILLQLARFPLFTARLVGDGATSLLVAAIRYLPIDHAKRQVWRERVAHYWSWLRGKISYRAFEQAVHDAFEGGMAWVFGKCRDLTPRAALLVIVGAVLWIPISFGAATAVHVTLIAKATSLPPWMQFLHPVATILAKSKLLVLPVYPAAWPRAKQHPFVQAIRRFCEFVASLHPMQKTGYRYRQTEHAAVETVEAVRGAAARAGISHWLEVLLSGLAGFAGRARWALRAALTRAVEGLSGIPMVGPLVRNYAAHYERVEARPHERLSSKVSGFFERWSIKFSPEYYEAKEREAAAAPHLTRGQ